MEVSDYLVYLLTGEVTRCMCHAGYKLLWNEEDGYPAKEFLLTNRVIHGLNIIVNLLQGVIRRQLFLRAARAGSASRRWPKSAGRNS